MLEINDLGFGYRHRRLFRGFSLQARPGDLVHIAGPNGAGKSTLMAVIAGLLSADEGTVSYTAAEGPVADRRRYLEYLPAEANGLYLKMSATKNLMFWARLRGVALTREACWEALTPWQLNLPLLRDNFPVEKFSTGMKRRLALARLQLSPAAGWLLDEPVYGLDTQAMGIFRSLLQSHLAKGGFAVVISHDLAPLHGLITATATLGTAARTPADAAAAAARASGDAGSAPTERR